MSTLRRSLRPGLLLALWTALAVLPVAAQEAAIPGGGLSAQSLRPYRFVFLAYAVAWIFVLGWVISVARRLARIDRRLGE